MYEGDRCGCDLRDLDSVVVLVRRDLGIVGVCGGYSASLDVRMADLLSLTTVRLVFEN